MYIFSKSQQVIQPVEYRSKAAAYKASKRLEDVFTCPTRQLIELEWQIIELWSDFGEKEDKFLYF